MSGRAFRDLAHISELSMLSMPDWPAAGRARYIEHYDTYRRLYDDVDVASPSWKPAAEKPAIAEP